MKSIKKVLAIWSIFFLFSLFISSCCTNDLEIIGEGSIKSTVLDRDVNIFSDTITGPFKIDIHSEVEVSMNDISDLGFTKGLAIACNENLINVIDSNSVEIILDKPFQYENSVYNSEKDLMLINEIKSKITFYDYVIIIEFDDNFFSKASFEKGIYNFKVNFKTSDNVSFSNNIDLFIDI